MAIKFFEECYSYTTLFEEDMFKQFLAERGIDLSNDDGDDDFKLESTNFIDLSERSSKILVEEGERQVGLRCSKIAISQEDARAQCYPFTFVLHWRGIRHFILIEQDVDSTQSELTGILEDFTLAGLDVEPIKEFLGFPSKASTVEPSKSFQNS